MPARRSRPAAVSPERASGVRSSSTGSVGGGGAVVLLAAVLLVFDAIEPGYSAEIRYR
jgi:hypothetical protein